MLEINEQMQYSNVEGATKQCDKVTSLKIPGPENTEMPQRQMVVIRNEFTNREFSNTCPYTLQ